MIPANTAQKPSEKTMGIPSIIKTNRPKTVKILIIVSSATTQTPLRKKFRKFREERQQSITVIETQIAKLKGERQLTAKHKESIGKLNAIRELAVKEKAKETAAGIEKLIAEQQKEFEATLKKLGFRQKPGGTNKSS